MSLALTARSEDGLHYAVLPSALTPIVVLCPKRQAITPKRFQHEPPQGLCLRQRVFDGREFESKTAEVTEDIKRSNLIEFVPAAAAGLGKQRPLKTGQIYLRLLSTGYFRRSHWQSRRP